MMKWLLTPPSENDFLSLLRAWKFWLFASVIGAVFGAGAYFIFPPDFRARATVVVDFNLEESLTEGNDRDIFYYLERESRKLVEIAWSDEMMEAVAQEFDNLTAYELRNEYLHLSQPQDGAWHFYADYPEPAQAYEIASTWAEYFNEKVQTAAINAFMLNSLKVSLENGEVDLYNVEDDIRRLEARSLGISAYLETYISQKGIQQITRTASIGEYIFFGSTGMLFLSALGILFSGRASQI